MDIISSQSISEATQPSLLNNFDRKQEIASLIRRVGTVRITFIKKDGTERVMKATLDNDVVIPYERKTERIKKPNSNTLSVWDVEKDAWRSINLDAITSIYFSDSGNDYSIRY